MCKRSSRRMGVKQNVALVAGITGLVGNSLAERLRSSTGVPWKVYGLARRPKPEWFVNPDVEYIQCDLMDRKQTMCKLSALGDVTHLFWVVWVHRSKSDEESNCKANGSMLSNALDALLPNAKDLQHICLQTGSKHYVGPESLWGKIEHVDPPFYEDTPRLPVPNFYYTLEDKVFEAAKRKKGLTWSVHRPSVIFGFAPRNFINLIGSVAVYASICRHQGLPFVFPGHVDAWESITDVSDADLIAEQEIWAATESRAKNQAFNVTNGDFVTWKRLWHLIARKFGLEVPPYSGKPTSVEKMMNGKEHIWEEIVRDNSLIHSSLEEIGRWAVVDGALNFPFRLLSSTNKSKEFGFHGFRNSEASLLRLIDKMRDARIVP